MSAVEPRRTLLVRARALPTWPVAVTGLSLLVAISVALRTTAIHAPFWIDEGLSVGIASHPFTEIPGVLRLDGSPPAYYLLLHVWMSVFGDGQATTHVLSLLFTLVAIPVAWVAARSLFGDRAGWFAAGLTAVNPFLTYYAQETRMYAMVSLLALCVAALLVHVFVFRRKRLIPVLSLAMVGMMYTHNWGLFLAAGSAVALIPAWRASTDRRDLLRDGVLAYGLVALAYLPWLPSLLFQAANTGAPWSETPDLGDVFGPIANALGGQEVPLGLLLAGGAGLATIAKERPSPGGPPVDRPRRVAVWVLVLLPLVGLTLAWTSSQISPGFAGRYFAVFVGPLLLLSGIGLAHAGRLGLVALAIIVALWFDPRTAELERKSDVRLVAAKIRSDVVPGDLVVSVHPEQTPLLHYYLPDGLRYADSIEFVSDPLVFDWVDALDRLQAARPTRLLNSYVSSLRPGQTLVLVLPIIRTGRWGAPWTKLVRKRSSQWERAADRSADLVRIGAQPRFGNRPLPRGVRTVLYRRTAVPRDVSEPPLGSVSGG